MARISSRSYKFIGLASLLAIITVIYIFPEADSLRRIAASSFTGSSETKTHIENSDVDLNPLQLRISSSPLPDKVQSNPLQVRISSSALPETTAEADASNGKSILPDNEQVNLEIVVPPPQLRISGRVFGRPLQFGSNISENNVAQGERVALHPRYICAGWPYEKFMSGAFQVATKKIKDSNSPRLSESGWGRYPTIVPPTKPTRKILIIGNSHTRQMAQAMEWQYRDQIDWPPQENLDVPGATAMKETFSFQTTTNYTTNVTITHVYNHACVYSPRWKQNLEEVILKHPLEELDAIVLGAFNRYSAHFRNTSQWQSNEYYRQLFPEQKVNMVENPTGFSLIDLAIVYGGPIVSVSMFDLQSQPAFQQNVRIIQRFTKKVGRKNLSWINARQYIPLIGSGECRSNEVKTVATCTNEVNGHRCMGNLGGLQDLVAWDLVETLHSLLSS